MNISSTPTNWLLVKADTNSEWDNCDFILVQLSKPYTAMLNQLIDTAFHFETVDFFYQLCFWDAPFGWYVYQDVQIERHLTEQGSDWSFVAFNVSNELNSLLLPEQKIDGCYLSFFSSGTARFNGSGKHSNEQFFSLEFPLREILQLYNTHPA